MSGRSAAIGAAWCDAAVAAAGADKSAGGAEPTFWCRDAAPDDAAAAVALRELLLPPVPPPALPPPLAPPLELAHEPVVVLCPENNDRRIYKYCINIKLFRSNLRIFSWVNRSLNASTTHALWKDEGITQIWRDFRFLIQTINSVWCKICLEVILFTWLTFMLIIQTKFFKSRQLYGSFIRQ